VPTSAGGQYAAFFDPNPLNNWQTSSAAAALTSMSVQDTAAAWECLKLVIPPAELERDVELYTSESVVENLVTRFGQLVLLNLAVSNTVPVGTAEVTVWMDATWEFYEPNVTGAESAGTLLYQPGVWDVTATGLIHPFGGAAGFVNNTWYRSFPELPETLFTGPVGTPYIGFQTSGPYAFATAAEAAAYAAGGPLVGILAGNATPVPLPAVALFPQAPALRAPVYPYKALPSRAELTSPLL